MNTIIVQMAEAQWTEEALHLACAMARSVNAAIGLLQLFPAQHYSWLGTPMGRERLSKEECNQLWKYKEIAADYGVEFSFEPMQYVDFNGAVVDACEQLGAEVVFVRVPESRLPLLRKYELWDLRRQLTKAGRTLYTLDGPVQAMVLAAQLGVLDALSTVPQG